MATRWNITEAECIKVLKDKPKQSLTARQVTFRILENRGVKIYGSQVVRAKGPVRKVLNLMVEKGSIDADDWRRSVRFQFISPEKKLRRAKQAAERKVAEKEIREILEASNFRPEEIEDLTELGGRVIHLTYDQLRIVFTAHKRPNGGYIPRVKCEECETWQNPTIMTQGPCRECGEEL